MTDPFTVPPQKKTGCLPRASKPGEWFPLASERVETISRSEWPSLIDSNRNSPLIWDIFDQDGVGSCASEASTQAVCACRELQGQERVPLNPWFVYHHVSGGVDRGSSIDENLRFIRDKGVASREVWPRNKGWRSSPSSEAYEDAKEYRIEEAYDVQNTDELVSCLFKGFPVVFGYRPGGGGHAVLAVDLESLQALIFANSWDESWGDQGFGELPLSRIDWRFGAWAVRSTTVNKEV